MTDSHCRVKRIRFKDGRVLDVFHGKRTETPHSEVTAHVIGALNALGNDNAGFVFMAWTADSYSVCDVRVKPNSPIPSLLLPEYVRNAVFVEVIDRLNRGG